MVTDTLSDRFTHRTDNARDHKKPTHKLMFNSYLFINLRRARVVGAVKSHTRSFPAERNDDPSSKHGNTFQTCGTRMLMDTDTSSDRFTHRTDNAKDCHTPTSHGTYQAAGLLTGLAKRKIVTHAPLPREGTTFRIASLERSIPNLRDENVLIRTLTRQGLLTGRATRKTVWAHTHKLYSRGTEQ